MDFFLFNRFSTHKKWGEWKNNYSMLMYTIFHSYKHAFHPNVKKASQCHKNKWQKGQPRSSCLSLAEAQNGDML